MGRGGGGDEVTAPDAAMIWENGWLGFTYDFLLEACRNGLLVADAFRAVIARYPLMRFN
jgi:hypothetical protein